MSQNLELLKARPQAQVSFNYLGQFAQELSAQAEWKLIQESGGTEHHAQERRSHLLEVNGLVINDQLQINWTYSQKIHQRGTIERLAKNFLEALEALIKHCQFPDAGGQTPSDFPDAELSQEELDELMSEFKVL